MNLRDSTTTNVGSMPLVVTPDKLLLPWLPRGAHLAEAEFARRHRILIALLCGHAPGLLVVALGTGVALGHAIVDIVPVLALAALATASKGHTSQACLTATGLLAASAMLIHISGGMVEAHFHIFVVLVFVALYQDWRPLLIGVGFTLVHHAGTSLISPSEAFNHHAAQARPVLWATIHAAFVAAEVVGILLFWRVTEQAQDEARSAEAQRVAVVGHNAELSAALERIEEISRTDELTGLPNRRSFMELLRAELDSGAQPLRRGSDRAELCVAIVDLDHFKIVNDTFGHQAGDEVLRAVATVSRAHLRDGDCFARLGGEEFGVLLRVTTIDEAVTLLERLRVAMHSTPTVPEDDWRVTLSAGLASYKPGVTVDELLAMADSALYAAKSSGRNRVIVDAAAPGSVAHKGSAAAVSRN